jgi:hypothetical protein
VTAKNKKEACGAFFFGKQTVTCNSVLYVEAAEGGGSWSLLLSKIPMYLPTNVDKIEKLRIFNVTPT